MSNFRRRLLGLTAMATAFVGVSYGQALTCTDATGNAPGGVTQPQINGALRAEGQTEQLSLLQFACTATAPAAGTTTATITITTNLPITSKATTAGGGNSEATLIVNGPAAGAGGVITVPTTGTAYAGTVADSGSVGTVTFSNVTIPTSIAGTISYFQVANVRVNASAATTVPYQTTESGLIAYTTSTTSGVTTAYTSVPATNNSGLVVKSLGAPVITGTVAPYTVCTGNATGVSFTLNINQIISGAFLGTGQPPVGEGGQYAPGAGSSIGAANADIINVTYAGLPSGSTVYVPQSILVGSLAPATVGPPATPAGNGTQLSIVGSTASTVVVGDVAYAVSSTGTVTIPYTVTAVSGLGAPSGSNFPVATVVAFAANTVTTPTTVTGTYNYAPQGATSLTGPAATVPTFSNATPTAVNGVSIVLCQTTLLFPFVTNQLGFNTGIAIANTSTDNLAIGGIKSVATAQGGTCQLYFYGTNTGAPAANASGVSIVPDPNGSLASGNVSTFLIGNVAPGYQGYMIAVCPFNYAHGYAFLTYGLTTNTGVAEGYIAEVIGSGDRGQSLASGDFAITF
jgi:hypothetical protein